MENVESKQTGAEAAGYFFGALFRLARPIFRGKHMSAAIIVLAGAILILGGSSIRHNDTKLFVQIFGSIFGTVGLIGWVFSSSTKSSQ